MKKTLVWLGAVLALGCGESGATTRENVEQAGEATSMAASAAGEATSMAATEAAEATAGAAVAAGEATSMAAEAAGEAAGEAAEATAAVLGDVAEAAGEAAGAAGEAAGEAVEAAGEAAGEAGEAAAEAGEAVAEALDGDEGEAGEPNPPGTPSAYQPGGADDGVSVADLILAESKQGREIIGEAGSFSKTEHRNIAAIIRVRQADPHDTNVQLGWQAVGGPEPSRWQRLNIPSRGRYTTVGRGAIGYRSPGRYVAIVKSENGTVLGRREFDITE